MWLTQRPPTLSHQGHMEGMGLGPSHHSALLQGAARGSKFQGTASLELFPPLFTCGCRIPVCGSQTKCILHRFPLLLPQFLASGHPPQSQPATLIAQPPKLSHHSFWISTCASEILGTAVRQEGFVRGYEITLLQVPHLA